MRRLLLTVLTVAGVVSGPGVHACAPAPREGERVRVASEEALIVWDPATRREHFIRRAAFEASGGDFGFLVPTPGRPELAEADDDVFVRLRAAIEPEHKVERRWFVHPTALVLMPYLYLFGPIKSAAPPPSPTMILAAPPVRVLEEKRVAGFDAAVLQATDTQALARWLKSHGYAWRPGLATWIAPYVERRYTISAFKIAPSAPGASLRTPALRMTFETDAPFFPYREPEDTPSRNGGTFSAFVVAPGRVAPLLGDDPAHPELSWWVKAGYSRPIGNASALLAGVLPGAPAAGLWLTSFEDRASERVGTDLWFTPSADRGEVVPPPIVTHRDVDVPLPLDLLAGVVLFGVWLGRRRRS